MISALNGAFFQANIVDSRILNPWLFRLQLCAPGVLLRQTIRLRIHPTAIRRVIRPPKVAVDLSPQSN